VIVRERRRIIYFLTLRSNYEYGILMELKFPDDACTMKNPPLLAPICIHGYFFLTTVIVLYVTLGCVLLVISAATTRRHLYDHLRDAWLEANPGKTLRDYAMREEPQNEDRVTSLVTAA
jgi:hypothetical protein